MELERTFFEAMRAFLKDELGVEPLLVGSSDHRSAVNGFSGYPHIHSLLLFDIIDGHAYWQHPTWDKLPRTQNTPMVNDPPHATVVRFARSPVVGRPFTISETNHPFPHEYSCEGIPILTAYALFHDWDGLYWFSYGGGRKADPKQGLTGDWLDFSNDPVKLTNLAACAVIWHRGDVPPGASDGRAVVHARPGHRDDADGPGDGAAVLYARLRAHGGAVHATRLTLRAEGTPGTPFPPTPRARPDRKRHRATRLVRRRPGPGPGHDRHRAGPGADRLRQGSGRSVSHLAADVSNEFCRIAHRARRRAAGEVREAAAGRDGPRDQYGPPLAGRPPDAGRPGPGPVVIEPVAGTVTLRGLGAVRRLRVRPLTAEGRPMEKDLTARPVSRGWEVRLGDPATTWCLIELVR